MRGKTIFRARAGGTTRRNTWGKLARQKKQLKQSRRVEEKVQIRQRPSARFALPACMSECNHVNVSHRRAHSLPLVNQKTRRMSDSLQSR